MRERGMILPIIALAFSVLIVLISTLGNAARESLHLLFPMRNALSSSFAARAGIARAIYSVKENEAGIPTACGYTGTPAFLSGQQLPGGSQFSVTVTNNADRSGAPCLEAAVAPDGTQVPPGCIYLSSQGKQGNSRRSADVMLKLNQGWIFPYALAANNADGEPTAINFVGGGTIDGDILANHGDVSVAPNTDVTGTVWTAYNGTVNSNEVTTGTIPAPLEMPPPPDDPYGTPPPSTGRLVFNSPGSHLPPGRYNEIVVGGRGTLLLDSGSYSINTLTVQGGGQIIISSSCSEQYPVKMWVYDSLVLTGTDAVNNQSEPLTATTFIIYGMPTMQTAILTGGATAAYALYAPYTDVRISGSSTIFGSIIADVITRVNGTPTVTYDQALSNDTFAGLTSVTVRGWKLQ